FHVLDARGGARSLKERLAGGDLGHARLGARRRPGPRANGDGLDLVGDYEPHTEPAAELVGRPERLAGDARAVDSAQDDAAPSLACCLVCHVPTVGGTPPRTNGARPLIPAAARPICDDCG